MSQLGSVESAACKLSWPQVFGTVVNGNTCSRISSSGPAAPSAASPTAQAVAVDEPLIPQCESGGIGKDAKRRLAFWPASRGLIFKIETMRVRAHRKTRAVCFQYRRPRSCSLDALFVLPLDFRRCSRQRAWRPLPFQCAANLQLTFRLAGTSKWQMCWCSLLPLKQF